MSEALSNRKEQKCRISSATIENKQDGSSIIVIKNLYGVIELPLANLDGDQQDFLNNPTNYKVYSQGGKTIVSK